MDNLLLESDGHAVFARECLAKDPSQALTVANCFAAYVEFCGERGWTALPRNRFTSVISDEVVRQFTLTTRHDIPDSNGKPQRGWKGIALKNFSQATDEPASEPSVAHPSDGTDTLFPVARQDIPSNAAVDYVEEVV